MAMEMWVLSDRELGSVAEWQAAIDAEGYPLQLSSQVQLKTHWGFLPAHLRGKLTGFEWGPSPADEFLQETRQEWTDVGLSHDWKFVRGFRWIGDYNELKAAWMAAVAYASATGGVIIDDQEPLVRTAAEGRLVVSQLERDIAREQD